MKPKWPFRSRRLSVLASLEAKMAISFEALLGFAIVRPFLDAKMAISLEASLEIRPFGGGPGASLPKFGKNSAAGNVAVFSYVAL